MTAAEVLASQIRVAKLEAEAQKFATLRGLSTEPGGWVSLQNYKDSPPPPSYQHPPPYFYSPTTEAPVVVSAAPQHLRRDGANSRAA